MTKNHPKEIFSSVTSRGAALWRSFSSSKMKQVQYETSMKNIPFVIAFAYFFEPSVAEDPSGATDCTTQWNKQPELVILLVPISVSLCDICAIMICISVSPYHA